MFEKDYKGRTKLKGMTHKDTQILVNMLSMQFEKKTKSSVQTVKEYIESHPEVKTERRISKKGTELIKVYYPTGVTKEYPVEHIERTCAFEY